MKTLIVTPPISDLFAPYPATSFLTSFLRQQNVKAFQDDLSIRLALKVFSKEGLNTILDEITAKTKKRSLSKGHSAIAQYFVENFPKFQNIIELVTDFLQGKNESMVYKLSNRSFYPAGAHSRQAWAYEHSIAYAIAQQLFSETKKAINIEDPLDLPFGKLGTKEKARYLATQFLLDIVNVVQTCIDPLFEISKYAEKLSSEFQSFDGIEKKLLSKSPTIIDKFIDELTVDALKKYTPDLLCLTVPFPGNVYGAFRIAMAAKKINPQIKTIVGGGFINTEMRSFTDKRVFEYFDYVSLDDGERPLLSVIKGEPLLRTFVLENNKIAYKNNPKQNDIPFKDLPTPTYDGLPLNLYLAVLENLSPFQALLSSMRWNKLILAHGCYWKKCAFCDVSLDYIARYQPATAVKVVDHIENLIKETGFRGFHFVDEAAPPALLKQVSEEIIKRKLQVTWWTNVRFDKSFTADLTRLMSKAGCIAVSGGIEAPSDRLLKLMNKGTSLEQVAQVTHNFSQSGIFVHSYLIYGFPTETAQETVDSLEYIRQLFKENCIHSGVWHRFIVTPFSPIGMNPEKFKLKLDEKRQKPIFSYYNIPFKEQSKVNHSALGEALKSALHHYIHQSGWDIDVTKWFKGIKAPKPRLPENFVRLIINRNKENA